MPRSQSAAVVIEANVIATVAVRSRPDWSLYVDPVNAIVQRLQVGATMPNANGVTDNAGIVPIEKK